MYEVKKIMQVRWWNGFAFEQIYLSFFIPGVDTEKRRHEFNEEE